MDIYLIRHGQSAGNIPGRITGWSDHPLTALGQAQATAAATRMAPLGPMPVVCSDLQRARQTAEIVAGSWGGTIETDARWREISCGRYEDCSWDDFTADTALSRQFDADPLGTLMPDGESITMLLARVTAAFTDLCVRTDNRLAVVTHDGPIRSLLYHCLHIAPDRFWALTTEHGGVTCLSVSADWINVRMVNATEHLAAIRYDSLA